jgi:hypothetical protein
MKLQIKITTFHCIEASFAGNYVWHIRYQIVQYLERYSYMADTYIIRMIVISQARVYNILKSVVG